MRRLSALPLYLRLHVPALVTAARARIGRRWRPVLAAGVAATVVATSAAAWEVERGDTLSGIAAATGTSVAQLARTNDIADPNVIIIGDVLEVATPEEAHADDDPGQPAASQANATPAAIGDPSDDRTHVVQPGETADQVAAQFGITLEQFMAANGMTSPGQLWAGKLVQAAANGPMPSTTSQAPASLTVRRGDTLEAIAQRVGSSVDALVKANGLANPNQIIIGQHLQVPGGDTGFACPVPGADFVNDWGVAKPDGRHHRGIDLHAPAGTPVLAPVSGWVDPIDGTRGGIQFKLTDDTGAVHWGAHMATRSATGHVEAGEVLGTVGTTGNALGGPSHLHYAVSVDGGTINPWPALAATC